MVANFVADSSSRGFFKSVIIPRTSEIKEMINSTLKSNSDGKKPVNGIKINETVANNAQITLSRNPNSRPLKTIHVILLPSLSPSMLGISKELMKII